MSKIVHRSLGALVFVVSLVQYVLTAQPSLSFWDPGELSAASYMLQVPHPPGGPLFLLVGRFFYMLPIPGDPGFRMNCVSVLSSALSVLLFYLIAVKIIENYKKGQTGESSGSVVTMIVAAVGALAFSFSDTFWFNGVESNYFAASTLLFSLIFWIMMIWNEKADQPGSNRYLILIAFLVGLSGGVHLMSVLTVVAVGYTVVLRKTIHDDAACKQSGYVLLGHIAVILVTAAILWAGQTSQQAPSPEETHAFDTRFVVIMLVLSMVVMGIFWKRVMHRNSLYLGLLVGGIALFSTYPGIVKLIPSLLLKIAGNDDVTGLVVLVCLLGAVGGVAYWASKNQKPILHLSMMSVMVAVLGFTTYAMIVIRAQASPPMNENNPKNFSQLVTYLNREQYGDFPIFKRRWDTQPEKQGIYTRYSSDLDYFWRYQMDHMFNRYVFWNFVGRVSSDQDAGVDWKGLFGIPFFMGLAGIYFHFRKDWKMASMLLLLFVFMGYLTAFYQNQQEPQPRDREYFYPGAYFIFALWITLGIRGCIDLAREHLSPQLGQSATFGIIGLGVLLIPGRMLQVNYYSHDRSKNWVPWDYSYNILQTCEKDAIIFTNGDNDTFPLWYLQDVEGIRRDVRVVCLSLVNTSWYIQQMKAKPYYEEAKAVPISLTNAQIERIQPVEWATRQMELAVPKEAIERYGVTDTAILRAGKITYTINPTLDFGGVKGIRVQDIMIQDIVSTNAWKRPVYFAVTVSPDSKIGLDEYLWFHGLAWRLEPRKASDQDRSLDVGILTANLFNEPRGFSKTPQYGYKWRGLNDPGVFFDENTQRLTVNYRSAFIRLALFYTNVQHDNVKSVAALDRMEQIIPRSKVPMGWELESDVASFYFRLGEKGKFDTLSAEVEKVCTQLLASGQANLNSYYNPYRVLLDIYETRKDYAKSLDLLKQLSAMYPNDPGLKQRITEVETQLGLQHSTVDSSAKRTP